MMKPKMVFACIIQARVTCQVDSLVYAGFQIFHDFNLQCYMTDCCISL